MDDRLNKEFCRLSAANTALMTTISKANSKNFDYEKYGEVICEEIEDRVKKLEKTIYDTKFFNMVDAIPAEATIKERVRAYVEAGTEISAEASEYKWKYFGGDDTQDKILRVGSFVKMSAMFYYTGKDIRDLNEHQNTVSYVLMDRFLQAPEQFLTDNEVEFEMKGSCGVAKHRVGDLNDILRKFADRKKLINKFIRYSNGVASEGYKLTID